MESLITVINALLPLLYLGLVVAYARYFYSPSPEMEGRLTVALPGVIAFHLLEMVLRVLFLERFPMANSPEAATALALCLALIYWYLEWQIKVKTTGAFLLALSLLLQIYSSLSISHVGEVADFFANPLFVFHTTSVLLGYTAFFVAAFFGVLYLLLHYQIKTAGFGIVFRRMPPLETLGEMCGKAIIPGFILLSSGILMGIYWRNASFPDDPHFDPKVVLTYAIWVYYLLLALGRLSRRLSGKLLAYGTLIGFVLITLNYLVIRFVVSSFHNFG